MGAPGCDDAPVVNVPLGKVAKHVTFIYPYYENPEFLARQVAVWNAYSNKMKEYLCVIVVDDGSPEHPARNVLVQRYAFPLRQFRIEVDVRWNWLAARNIGAHHAAPGWVLLTDMDHMVSENVLRTLVYGCHDETVIYRFSRIGAKTHPHPNSWFMTRGMFWRIGGYDEACSGYYGTDGDYRRRCAATAEVHIMDVALECHEHEGDASTRHYQRKQPEDAIVKKLIRARKPDWQPRVLSFPYHEVML